MDWRMMSQRERKIQRTKTRKDRTWNHFIYYSDFSKWSPFINMKEIKDYNPEHWRVAFEMYQEKGRKFITPEEYDFIQPILNGQRTKEIMLDSLAEESMEFWAKGWGWIIPWVHTLETVTDRLTKVAILRTLRKILGTKLNSRDYHPESIIEFFKRHPGISEKSKQRYFDVRWETLNNA